MFRLAAVSIVAASAIGNADWDAFKITHQRVFETAEEELERFELFLKTVKKVKELNALQGKNGDAFGVTWLADRHPSEVHQRGYKAPGFGVLPTPTLYQSGKLHSRANPSSINWRETEAVTAIKNQGQCGSCWAFGSVSAIESQLILSSGAHFAVELSPQQVASCTSPASPFGCFGCFGGFPEGAYMYAQSVAGITNSFFMPYEQPLVPGGSSRTVPCNKEAVEDINGTYARLQGGYAVVSGYDYAITPCEELETGVNECLSQDLDGLKAALEETPMAVLVNAANWNSYTGGVLSAAACGGSTSEDMDHAVMITGFNAEAETPYWIVRNSWSDTWGVDGYVYLDMSGNTCGVANSPTIPKVAYSGATPEVSKVAARRKELFAKATRGATLNFQKSMLV